MTLCLFLFLVSMASCTVTKQRYSAGYHIEWNKRKVVSYADKAPEKSAFEAQKTSVFPDKAVAAILLEDTLCKGKSETVENTDSQEGASYSLKKVVEKPRKKSGVTTVDNTFSKSGENSNFLQSDRKDSGHKRSDFSESLSDFFFVFCIILMLLVIPPLLHTLLVASFFHFKNDTLFLVLEWLIWGAGIVAIIVFFSSALTIVLTCLGWNLIFALFVSAIILNQ